MNYGKDKSCSLKILTVTHIFHCHAVSSVSQTQAWAPRFIKSGFAQESYFIQTLLNPGELGWRVVELTEAAVGRVVKSLQCTSSFWVDSVDSCSMWRPWYWPSVLGSGSRVFKYFPGHYSEERKHINILCLLFFWSLCCNEFVREHIRRNFRYNSFRIVLVLLLKVQCLEQGKALFLRAGRRRNQRRVNAFRRLVNTLQLGQGLVNLNWCLKAIHKVAFASLKSEMSSQIAEIRHNALRNKHHILIGLMISAEPIAKGNML